jgi:hypothetical protein
MIASPHHQKQSSLNLTLQNLRLKYASSLVPLPPPAYFGELTRAAQDKGEGAGFVRPRRGDTLSTVAGDEPACRQTGQTKQLTKLRCTQGDRRIQVLIIWHTYPHWHGWWLRRGR